MPARRLLARPVLRPVLTVAGTAAALLLVPLAGGASAHVSVSGADARPGAYTKLTFRAPTEKDVATTALEIALPTDTPIASIRVKPKTGWTAELVKGAPAQPLEVHGSPVTEVVTRIVWTATGKGIGPDEFDEFEVSAGPLPETERLVFKALQTYADGEVVRWIEEAAEGAEEPELPAPVLTLAPAEESEEAGTAAAEAAPDTEPVASTSAADGGPSLLAGSALAVGLVALALAAFGALRGRHTT